MNLRDNLRRDAVRALRVLEPVEMEANGTVGGAIARMQHDASGCVIVTRDGRPVGIFTERDVWTQIVLNHQSLETPLSQLMTSPPQTVREGESVESVIRRMHGGGFRHMPVVNEEGILQGVISVKRIIEYLVEHFPSAVFNLPPDPGQRQLAREGA